MNIPVIMGPTASGKSALAMRLAGKYNGEIISVDSMQLYCDLNIGSAKPSKEEQRQIRHHLIDLYDIQQKGDVFQFVELARQAIDSVQSRGKLPILCGGTGFYFKALLYGLDDLPGDRELRASLDLLYDSVEGFPELKKRMEELDLPALQAFGNCRRKLIRALEVKLLSGRSILDLQRKSEPKLRYPVVSYWLDRPRDLLKERIRLRCRQMLAAGWIDEARALIDRGLLETPTAWQALGYRQIGEYLQNHTSLAELEEQISTATWQFARRQITWFRGQHPESRAISDDLIEL